MPNAVLLSPELIRIAKAMRSDGVPWKKIGYELGTGEYKIRCELEPGYRVACADRVNRIRAGSVRPRPPRFPRVKKSELPRPPKMKRPSDATGHNVTSATCPSDVLADRDRRAAMDPASLTASLCGDPLPGRSALDQRKLRVVVSND